MSREGSPSASAHPMAEPGLAPTEYWEPAKTGELEAGAGLQCPAVVLRRLAFRRPWGSACFPQACPFSPVLWTAPCPDPFLCLWIAHVAIGCVLGGITRVACPPLPMTTKSARALGCPPWHTTVQEANHIHCRTWRFCAPIGCTNGTTADHPPCCLTLSRGPGRLLLEAWSASDALQRSLLQSEPVLACRLPVLPEKFAESSGPESLLGAPAGATNVL